MQPENLVEKLKNYTAIGYLIFLFWGLLNEHIYYSLFNINITGYLEITEVLLLMYDEVLTIILFVVLGGIAFVMIQFIIDLAMLVSYIFKRFRGKSQPKYLNLILTMIGWIILVVSADHKDNALPFLGFSIGLFATAYYDLKTKSKNFIIVPIILITLIFLIHPINKHKKLLEEGSPHKVILKDSTFLYSKSPILIGETRNYVFLYLPSDSSTVGINRTEIKSIIYQKEDRD
jgi:hypothetical protein